MADALSDALHKLSVAGTPRPEVTASPCAATQALECQANELTDVGSVTACESANSTSCPDVARGTQTAHVGPPSAGPHAPGAALTNESCSANSVDANTVEEVRKGAMVDSDLTSVEPTSAPAGLALTEAKTMMDSTSTSDGTFRSLLMRPVNRILDNRRQAAAAVVIICMVIFWYGDGATNQRTIETADTLAEDFSEVEAALSEFSVRSAGELKEPAEPINTPSDFNLIIPSQDSMIEAQEVVSESSDATASYPSLQGSTGTRGAGFETETNPVSGSASTGFSTAPVSNPTGAGRSIKAKLSNVIQSIN